MYSGRSTRALPRVGFPIRTSRDRRLVSTSPGLFAAAHVLHRLLAPRHPPCALVLLIRKNTMFAAMEFSRCARSAVRRATQQGVVSQNSTACAAVSGCLPETFAVEVDVVPGEPRHRTIDERPSTSWTPTGVRAPVFPRKEVIQPQLPLRLPCYDFTPVTDPTFDGSLPCGLGHRLRVLPASVV
jgi:hypothetical protein